MQVAVALILLRLTAQTLAVRRGWLFQRSTYAYATLFGLVIGLYQDMYSSYSTTQYTSTVGLALLLSPFFLVPGHEQLRERALRLRLASRWQRVWSPYAQSYGVMLLAAAILFLPLLAYSLGLFDLRTSSAWSSQPFHGTPVIFLLFYTWACLISALVEHCELYARRRGRLLALLVSLLFIVAPVALLLPLARNAVALYISPFAWLGTYGGREDNALLALLLQFIAVGLATFGLQLWTDFQRKKLERAQRKRIEEVLAIGDGPG